MKDESKTPEFQAPFPVSANDRGHVKRSSLGASPRFGERPGERSQQTEGGGPGIRAPVRDR